MQSKTKKKLDAKHSEKIRKNAKIQMEKAKKRFKNLEKKVESFAKKNPGKALLIASGIGAALGSGVTALIKRKKK